MLFVKYIIIYVLLLFIEKNLVHLIAIKHITPDLILIFVIIISLREDRGKSTVIGFFAGLFQDVFTTGFFGLSAMTKSMVGFLGFVFQQPKKKYNLTYYIIIFAILVFIHEIIYQFIYSLGGHISFFRLLFYYIIPKAIYTVIVAIMVYFIFKPILWKLDDITDQF